jgi:hypothetical protein
MVGMCVSVVLSDCVCVSVLGSVYVRLWNGSTCMPLLVCLVIVYVRVCLSCAQ